MLPGPAGRFLNRRQLQLQGPALQPPELVRAVPMAGLGHGRQGAVMAAIVAAVCVSSACARLRKLQRA